MPAKWLPLDSLACLQARPPQHMIEGDCTEQNISCMSYRPRPHKMHAAGASNSYHEGTKAPSGAEHLLLDLLTMAKIDGAQSIQA